MTSTTKYSSITGEGFTGAYDPSALLLKNLFDGNKVNASSPSTSRRKRRAISSNPTLGVSGILSPTSCLLHNEPLLFVVSNNFFPEYDVTNLYNTNPDFDYGPLKDLAEKHRLMGTNSTLFAFRFQTSGVYVFKVSSANDKKMVMCSLFSKFII